MPRKFNLLSLSAIAALTFSYPNWAAAECMSSDWVTKSDEAFAADCVDFAFGGIEQREIMAWLFFVRTNQLVEDKGGVSDSGRVPVWMTWATDADTFVSRPSFTFNNTNRDDLQPVTDKQSLLAGKVLVNQPNSPNSANEEVTRNEVAFNYITSTAKLNTKSGVIDYLNAGNDVQMPVGSVEIKASWLRVPDGGSAPDGALTYNFKSGAYWFRGMHIMAKMQPAPAGTDLFYSENPSWFWTTFEFNNNPGIAHVRENLITQRAPLLLTEIAAFLQQGGVSGFGFENYAPNGTQIRYTVDGAGETPVILGHTDMEDFAGAPNTAQPRYWTHFEASCHACHATAAINPKTKTYFPFTVPTGALTPEYNGANPDPSKPNLVLGDGFKPLDFMWPIVFHAK